MKVVVLLTALSVILAVTAVCLALALRRARRENVRLRSVVVMSSKYGSEDLQELRRLRHDMRHYLVAGGTLPPVPKAGSGGSAVDAVTEHYKKEAAAIGASQDLILDLTGCADEMLPDLCLVVGNLLENAVESLRREGGGWIRARCINTDGYISLVVGNSCKKTLKKGPKGYISSKSPGRTGMGLDTVEKVARRRGGGTSFTADGERFTACVFLPCRVMRGDEDPETPSTVRGRESQSIREGAL